MPPPPTRDPMDPNYARWLLYDIACAIRDAAVMTQAASQPATNATQTQPPPHSPPQQVVTVGYSGPLCNADERAALRATLEDATASRVRLTTHRPPRP